MTRRMLEYALAIRRKFGRFPEQIVLYAGNDSLRMKRAIVGPGLSFRCRTVDIRDIDSEPLLSSTSPAQNVIAVLRRLGNERETVKRILGNIAAGRDEERGAAQPICSLWPGCGSGMRLLRRRYSECPFPTTLWVPR